MAFKQIKTDRLLIRRLSLEDAKALSRYRSCPKVAKFQSWNVFSEGEATKLIKDVETSDPKLENMWFQFGLEFVKTGQLIGDIGFLNSDKDGKSWIGFTIDSNFWRQGFGAEAVEKVLQYYQEMGTSEVWASIDPNNVSSQKLLEKLCFKLSEKKPGDLIFHKKLV